MHVSDYFLKTISYGFLLCNPVIGLDLESHSNSREKVQFFETRLRNIFLALTWGNEIEIIIWPFSYFETRTRSHIVILIFRDLIETLENISRGRARKNEADSRRELPGARILADLWFDVVAKEFWVIWHLSNIGVIWHTSDFGLLDQLTYCSHLILPNLYLVVRICKPHLHILSDITGKLPHHTNLRQHKLIFLRGNM